MDTESRAFRIVAFLGIALFLGGIGIWLLISNISNSDSSAQPNEIIPSAPLVVGSNDVGDSLTNQQEQPTEESITPVVPEAPSSTVPPDYEYYQERNDFNAAMVYPLEWFFSRSWDESPAVIEERLMQYVRPALLADMMGVINDFDWETCRQNECVIDAENTALVPTKKENVYFASFMLVEFTKDNPEGSYYGTEDWYVEMARTADGGWTIVSLTDGLKEAE